MNVVTLHETTLADVPGMLRRMADDYQAGRREPPRTLVWAEYRDDGSVAAGEFGANHSRAEIIGVLHIAAAKLAGGSDDA